MAAPEDIPRDGDGTTTANTWSETPDGAVTPSSGRLDTGWLNGDAVTQGEMNYLGQTPARWTRAYFAETPRASQSLVASWLYPGTANPVEGLGTWSDTGVGPLEGFLSDATGIPSRTVDVWVDPDSNGAKGLQVKVSLASPKLFTAQRDTYVYVDITTAVAGLTTGLTFLEVPNADPAPAKPAGAVLFWIVETDLVSITGQSIVVPTFPIYKSVGFETLNAGDLNLGGMLNVGGTTDLTGAVTCLGDVTLGDAIGDAIRIDGTLTCNADATFNGISTFNDTLDATMDVVFSGGIGNFLTATVDCTLGNSAAFSHTINGDLTIGATSAETLSVNSTFDQVILAAAGITGASGGNPVDLPEGATIAANKSIDGDATTTITTGGVSTLSADGIVAAGEFQFFADAAPSIVIGTMQFDGKTPTIGTDGVARKVSVPIDDWVAGDISTAAAIVDTGASVTMVVDIGDVLMIEMRSEMTSDTVGVQVNFRIEAAAVTIGGTAQRYIDAAATYTNCDRSVEYTSGINGALLIKARYGAVGGNTTTARNILLTVRRKN